MTTAAPDSCALPDVAGLTVGVLGGTGPQGRGLALRLAAAGQRVLLGSREADRAVEVAAHVAERASALGVHGDVSVRGGANVDVAGAADLVIVAVPFAGHAATWRPLRPCWPARSWSIAWCRWPSTSRAPTSSTCPRDR